MLDCIWVGLGGFIGSICRYLIGLLPIKAESGFPIKTLCINVMGAFLIGLLTAAAAKSKTMDSRIVLMLRVGVCGGFTTFSTFAYEAAELMQNGNMGFSVCYICVSVILGILAIFAAQMMIH